MRRGGAPLGNQNAAKSEVAKRVTIRLYGDERASVKATAKKLQTSQNDAHRKAIKMLAKSLGLGG